MNWETNYELRKYDKIETDIMILLMLIRFNKSSVKRLCKYGYVSVYLFVSSSDTSHDTASTESLSTKTSDTLR